MRKHKKITVKALSKSRTFRNRRELEEFVGALEARGGPYDLLEYQCRAAVRSGSTSAVFPEPEPLRRPSAPTSHDDELAAAEAQVAERQRDYDSALDRRLAITDWARVELARARRERRSDLLAVQAELGAQVREAVEDFRKSSGRLRRAKAARNAIAATVAEERILAEARYHNPTDPSRPLTTDELRELLEEV